MKHFTIFLLILTLLIFPIEATQKTSKNKKRIRRISKSYTSTVPDLMGSKKSQKRQNKEADRQNLSRIKNDKELYRFIQAGLLVPLPHNKYVQVDPRLNKKYRYCRPWVRDWLNHFGQEEYFQKFKRGLRVNSAVRTVVYQKRLQRKNPNAAPAEGSLASSHLTGATIDLSKKKMSKNEIIWIRQRLIRMEKMGLIEATEEFKQSVFHIMVFRGDS